MEIDIHIHSRFSPDSRSRPDDIVKRARSIGLGAIAVTDHDSLEGAEATAKLATGSLLVIPGMEVKTEKGDLLALFVSERVRARTFASTVDDIGSMEGIAIVPHPGASQRMTMKDIAIADGLEVFNSTLSSRENQRSLIHGTELKMPRVSCSDAHMVMEIGNGTTSMQDCSSLEELRKNLLKGPVVSETVRSNVFMHRANEALVLGLKGIRSRL